MKNKKKIYLVTLPDDAGEMWLDENKKPLSFVCAGYSSWSPYSNLRFIIDYFNGELIDLPLQLSVKDIEKIYENGDSLEKVYKIVKKYLK